jgi:phage terminase small subunit
MPPSAKLTPHQQRFVEEYLVDLNGTQAAIRAGYSRKSAKAIAHENLQRPAVLEALTAERAKMSARTHIAADDVLQRWVEIARANPNDLVQHRRGPCRYCHGKAHAYQWKTPREFLAAIDCAKADGEPEPTDAGGYGYRTTAPINPDCPECSGEGIGYSLAVDTRHLPPEALALFAGVKQTRDGLEIKMHDQAKALDSIARHLGMFVDHHEIGGKGGGPISITISRDDAEL